MNLSWSAILTSSGKDLAYIFFSAWLRCIVTVVSLAPSSAPTCSFNIPETTIGWAAASGRFHTEA
jgi:hypothetical protein